MLLSAGGTGGPDSRLGRAALRDLQGLRASPYPCLARTREFCTLFWLVQHASSIVVTQGSQQLFDKVISPLVRPYERPLNLVGFVLGGIVDLAFALLLFVPRKFAQRWRRRKESPNVSSLPLRPAFRANHFTSQVPAILRGLRQPHQPRLAQSLADSIEKSQGDSDAISARFSQPLQVRLNPVPFRPQRPANAPMRQPSEQAVRRPTDQPLPPAASSAPFRHVPVIPPTRPAESERAKPAQRPPPIASASRLPVPQPARRAPPTQAEPPSTWTESLYPSLASVSGPLEQPKVPSSTLLQHMPRSPAAPASLASSKNKGKARRRAEDDGEATRASPRTKRARSSRRSSPPLLEPAPEIEVNGTANDSPPRSTPPPIASTSTATLPPPTPAPPGAFSFRSPAQVPLPDSPAVRTSLPDESESAQTTPRRRSARTSTVVSAATSSAKGKKRARESSAARGEAVDTNETVTPKKKVARVQDADGADGEHARETWKKGRLAEDAVATPRQRALGAIAQLSKDLFDDEDDEEGLGLGSKTKKKGVTSVLGKSKAGGAPGSRLRQNTRRRTADDEDEDYAEDEQLAGPSRSTAASRGRTAARNSTSASVAAKRSAATTSVTAPRSVSSASLAASASSRPSSRLARSTLTRARPASSSTPATEGDSDELSLPARAKGARRTTTSAGASEGAPPPPRRARRVLLGRVGSAAAEEEHEVDGVAVIPRQRAARK